MTIPNAGSEPMSAEAAVISIVVAGLIFWLVIKYELLDSAGERRFNAAYRTRVPMSDEEMLERFYAGSSIDRTIPARVRRIFGEQLQYDPERLHPDDDFMFILAEIDCVELIMEIEGAFEIQISDDDAT